MSAKKTTTKKPATKAQAPKAAKVKPKAAKAGAAATTKKVKADGKTRALDAAAKVLENSDEPLTTRELIEAMATKGLWSSPGGKTPDRTLYSAIAREINTKGADARFVKADRGKFAAKQ